MVLLGLPFPLVDDDAVLAQVGEDVAHDAQRAVAQEVDLDQAEEFGAVLLPGDGGGRQALQLLGRGMDRHHLADGVAGDDDPAAVDAEIADRPDEIMGGAAHLIPSGVGAIAYREGALERQVALRVGDRGTFLAEHASGFAPCALMMKGLMRAHERDVLAPEGVDGLLQDGIALVMGEIDVDVGRIEALLAQEPLEDQLVLEGIDVRDAQDVADQTGRRRSAPTGLPEAREVPHGEDVGGEALLGEDVQFVVQPLPDLGRSGTAIALPDAFGAALAEFCVGILHQRRRQLPGGVAVRERCSRRVRAAPQQGATALDRFIVIPHGLQEIREIGEMQRPAADARRIDVHADAAAILDEGLEVLAALVAWTESGQQGGDDGRELRGERGLPMAGQPTEDFRSGPREPVRPEHRRRQHDQPVQWRRVVRLPIQPGMPRLLVLVPPGQQAAQRAVGCVVRSDAENQVCWAGAFVDGQRSADGHTSTPLFDGSGQAGEIAEIRQRCPRLDAVVTALGFGHVDRRGRGDLRRARERPGLERHADRQEARRIVPAAPVGLHDFTSAAEPSECAAPFVGAHRPTQE